MMLAKMMSLFLLGLIRALTGAQARWQGCPPKAEQRIYFANHQSHADLVLMWAALPEELRTSAPGRHGFGGWRSKCAAQPWAGNPASGLGRQ